jgi:hypothetical protein
MASVWQVYYQHWAKQSNRKRYEIYFKNATFKTIRLLWFWYEAMPVHLLDSYDFESSAQKLLEELSILGTMLSIDPDDRLEDQMGLLRSMSEYLCPNHLPRRSEEEGKLDSFVVINDQIDRGSRTPWFVVPPTEARLTRNLGLCSLFRLSNFDLSTDQCRRLDAILALF